jgi:Icc-related predicted phosphoesterase
MGPWLCAADLHGRVDRYRKLVAAVRRIRPAAVFLGGDLLPFPVPHRPGDAAPIRDFLGDFVIPAFGALREEMGAAYPRVFVILGNDDPAVEEAAVRAGEDSGLWDYAHGRRVAFGEFEVYGYACVPPTPFQFKDWERYDVSRYVPPGSVSPEEGIRSVSVPASVIRHATIQGDLAALTADAAMDRAVLLFHTPPHETVLDRAALDGKRIDHVPLDVHVGSIAVRRFIDTRQPWITLHGHVHESARLTGAWRQRIGRTHLFGAAHDGPELALVQFDPRHPDAATRELL